jgi:hypothetical protein
MLAFHLSQNREHLVAMQMLAERRVENRRKVRHAAVKALDPLQQLGIDGSRNLRSRHRGYPTTVG